ncbi:MAG: hypothetical protein ACYC3G_02255 [Minisyncoccota bacterium]
MKVFNKIQKIYIGMDSKYSRKALMALASMILSISLTSTALAISFYGPEITEVVPLIGPSLPEKNITTPRLIEVDLTAYSSTEDQTDSTPFIAASGKHVYDGMVAANFLPFGTKIKIPEIFGDKIFTVDDRMNKRYQNTVDIWFADRHSAVHFGIQKATIEIVNPAPFENNK